MGPHPHKTVVAGVAKAYMGLAETAQFLSLDTKLALLARDSDVVQGLAGLLTSVYDNYDQFAPPAVEVVRTTINALAMNLTAMLNGADPGGDGYLETLERAFGVDHIEAIDHVARIRSN